jgi:hypothetical protein
MRGVMVRSEARMSSYRECQCGSSPVGDPSTKWVTGMTIDATDERGRELHAEGHARSRMILPGSSSICINTSVEWTIDGVVVHGEDQDVWPIKEYRTAAGTRP